MGWISHSVTNLDIDYENWTVSFDFAALHDSPIPFPGLWGFEIQFYIQGLAFISLNGSAVTSLSGMTLDVAIAVQATLSENSIAEGDYVRYVLTDGVNTIDESIQLYPTTPSVELTASDESIVLGDSITLSWVSTNATLLMGGVNFTPATLNGSIVLMPLATITYSITVRDDNLVEATDSVTVTVDDGSGEGGEGDDAPPTIPPTIGETATGGPGFETVIISATNGAEQRIAKRSVARHKYTISYQPVTEQDYQDFVNFFLSVYGIVDAIRFRDWADYSVGGDGVPHAFAIGDGVTKVFQLQKVYASYRRNIVFPVKPIAIYVGGSVLSTGYGVNYATGKVYFADPPADDAVIAWIGEFDTACRFDTDRMDLSFLVAYRAEWLDIALVEVV